jgi:diguanylate cyclase (GGDEF)-like protein/PAS domain S-box-containing protein
MNPSYAVYLIVSGAISLVVASTGWKRRSAPGAPALTILSLGMAVWSLTYAAFWLSVSPSAQIFWMNSTFFGVAVAPMAFLVMVQEFIGRGSWLTRRAYLLLSTIPFLTLVFIWVPSLNPIFFSADRAAGDSVILRGGPWFTVFVFYMYALMTVSMLMLINAHIKASLFYSRQTRVVLIGALIPWAVNGLVLFHLNPLPGLDLTPLAFAGSGLFFSYGFFGYHMMDLVPVGRDMLVENIDDAIVVVDPQDRIVDINPKAMAFIDPGLSQPFGKKLEEVFSRWADVISMQHGLEGRTEVSVDRPPYSSYELMVLSLKDRTGLPLGKLVSWRDITARKQVERKLRVFFHAVEQNPTAIVITDLEARIEYVNPRLLELTGYSLEDVRGKTPSVFKSGETTDELYAELWKTVKAGQIWQGELFNRKKNGQTYWVHEMIAPVLNGDGVVTHFVAMQDDISERKRTELELRELNESLQLKLAEIESLHDQLREEAIRDGLTRLFNRRYMEETLEREISRVERKPQPISVVMMDVDFFKVINDKYGHQAGDAVLQTLGTLLLESTRISDIACRYGGDEMLVVMPEAAREFAVARAEEWRTAFSMMEFTFGDARIKTTLSLGVASFPDQAKSPSELLNASDRALYWAKIKRNQVQVYDPQTMGHGQYRSDDAH